MARPVDDENPDRLYTVTGGRSLADKTTLDVVTLIVSECEPTRGMQSEYVRILQMCREPAAVVEIASELKLPVSIAKILLCDLLDSGRITARNPVLTRTPDGLPDPEILKQVLVGLQNI